MAEPRRPSPDDVRAVVSRIVDATLAGRPAGAANAGPSPKAGQGAATGTDGGGREGIAIGGDHGGWVLKLHIGLMLADDGYAVHDCGTNSPDPVDYPDIALAVAQLVADGTCRWGIVVDGAGIGSAMVANKVPGVRAANCHDLSSARNSREHNHANVLTLGARVLGEGLATDIVRTWLATDWGPGRHAARVEKITQVERRFAGAAAEGRAR